MCAWAALALAGCSPALNWREARFESAPVSATLPCKPDRGTRTVPFAGRETPLQMMGCDASGMTFAVARADISPEADAAAVLQQWKQLTLAHVQAQGVQEQAVVVPGATLALRLRATGRRPDGAALQTEALYLAQGRQVVQAVWYGAGATPASDAKAASASREAADTFLASVRLQ